MIIDIAQNGPWDKLKEVLWLSTHSMEKYEASPAKAAAFQLAQLRVTAAKPAACVMAHARNEQMAGVAALEPSDWESKIYRFLMGKISILLAVGTYTEQLHSYHALLAELETRARAGGLRHLACRVDTRDTAQVHSLESAGFLLMDTTLEYLWKPGLLTPEPPPKWIIRPHQAEDLAPLTKIARTAFTDRMKTRYAEDSHLPLEQTRELYAEWLLESCRGTFAHVVLVAEAAGKPIGFQTYKIDEEFFKATGVALATFGLGTVLSEQRGQRIFPSLLRAVVRWGEGQGVTLSRGRVVVHNLPMQRACQRSGAYVGATFHTFHKWLGSGRPALPCRGVPSGKVSNGQCHSDV
ncbi:MAG: hypothetical protein HYR55_11265 [Acidobacteria bacterium]|nr:hypothetical protein [Acidobacteriota bacterium]MBI3658236.1 hypothetical protein [Acidobacteriota bacterium]